MPFHSRLPRPAAQLVVAGAIGARLDRQRQRRRGCDRSGRIGIAAPRQDVEHDVAAEQPGCKRFRSVPSSWRPNGSEIGLT
jgi:hypothetical protein